MTELIQGLPTGARVLDLGARSGSFQTERRDIVTVRLDLEIPAARSSGSYVAGDASRMPFAAASFAAVISNHSLEHFVELDATLREIGRVVKPEGSLYVAVPDAGTLTDRIYRWMGRGGGHVNAFYKPEDVASRVTRLTGLPHLGTQPLYSSLSFLNAHNFTTRPPRKIALFGFGNERFLAVLMWMLRLLDRRVGSRLSQYGWAFHFGAHVPSGAAEEWINVCVRCGSGHSEMFLQTKGAIRPLPGAFDWYCCPVCGGLNLLTREE